MAQSLRATTPRGDVFRFPGAPTEFESPNERGKFKSDKRRYRTIWISDLHLGTKGCQAHLLLQFLKKHSCENLYLVGDIIDGWRLRKSWYWTEEQNSVVKQVLKMSGRGTQVRYICGNHDEFARDYIGLSFGGVQILDEAEHICADGKRMLVQHGDRFDICIRTARWLAFLGDRAYNACLTVNTWFNYVRRKLGYPYWSLSAYLKLKVKNAVSYIGQFEEAVAHEAKDRGFDGVVCGHIHHAEIREVNGVLYCNDGDWVESCTALVEHFDGSLEIVDWSDRRFSAQEDRAETPLEAVLVD